jgi:hypothetical protein
VRRLLEVRRSLDLSLLRDLKAMIYLNAKVPGHGFPAIMSGSRPISSLQSPLTQEFLVDRSWFQGPCYTAKSRLV